MASVSAALVEPLSAVLDSEPDSAIVSLALPTSSAEPPVLAQAESAKTSESVRVGVGACMASPIAAKRREAASILVGP